MKIQMVETLDNFNEVSDFETAHILVSTLDTVIGPAPEGPGETSDVSIGLTVKSIDMIKVRVFKVYNIHLGFNKG